MNTATDSAYRVALIDSTECAPGVRSFRFDRPQGYAFTAGQFLELTIETRDGPQAHYFSLAAAPGDPWLEVATRMTGSVYKDALAAILPGDEATISGPKGRLRVPDGVDRVAFLVGGIGITPARSIIRDADQRSTGLRIALFYGNQDESGIPFSDELAQIAERHAEIDVIDVIASPSPTWAGERGFITAEVVRRHIDPSDGWHFIVAGPPPMIEPMRNVLDLLDVPAQWRSVEAFAVHR